MRVFAKHSLQFDHPANEEGPVVVQALSFANVPEWVKDSNMFKLATSGGVLDVVETKEDEKKAETPQTDPELEALLAEAKELGVKGNLSAMKRETLEAKIAEAKAAANGSGE